jgi:glycosyltransferase involved in cell wall biosynthesis
VPFGDEKALTEALLTLANDAELRKNFADESEKIVKTHLSAERLMREAEEFYEQCALEEKKALNSDLAIES